MATTLVVFLGTIAGLAQSPADPPVARTDQNSLTAHAQLLEKAKRGRIQPRTIPNPLSATAPTAP